MNLSQDMRFSWWLINEMESATTTLHYMGSTMIATNPGMNILYFKMMKGLCSNLHDAPLPVLILELSVNTFTDCVNSNGIFKVSFEKGLIVDGFWNQN